LETIEQRVLRPEQTRAVTRGARTLLRAMGYAVLAEFPLANGRRADLAALAKDGTLRIVEVKSCVADFRADDKWTFYRAYCDRFYFAAPLDFSPGGADGLFPQDAGLIVADAHGAALEREAPIHAMAPAARKAMLVRFGALAATRLHSALHPGEP
jgi:hypothetical protein